MSRALAASTRSASRPWQRLGLRARVTVIFGLGALMLSATMAGITYVTARQFIVRERDAAILRQAYVNASFARSELLGSESGIDYTQLLYSLDTVPGSLSVIEHRGLWYGTSFTVSELSIPTALRRLVLTGTPATQHFMLDGSPQLVVGIPIPAVQGAYFEFFSLADIARDLRILALALGAAALFTTVAGAVTGRWVSGRALRPLGEVSKTAETIAGGKFDTRLETAEDPDLSGLSASFNRMADALVERIEREVRFTADVSHELRSPLTTLTTALEVLESHQDEFPPRTRSALELITSEVHRFQTMVEDLLEISRMDTGAAELLLEEVDVGEFARHAAVAVGAQHVRVDVDPAARGQRVALDKRRMERVIANLVSNAAQYGGGATRISVEPAPQGVRIVVADRGPGVAESERERIFERFYRGRRAHERGTTQGTGLGLSLVAEHVKLHGGRVWMEDEAGVENRFVIELPSRSEEGDGPVKRSTGTESDRATERDDPDNPNDATESAHSPSRGAGLGARQ